VVHLIALNYSAINLLKSIVLLAAFVYEVTTHFCVTGIWDSL